MISTAIADQLVTHTATDETGLDEITEAMEGWYNHPNFDPELPVLWDLRGSELSIPEQDVTEWSERNRTMVNDLRAGRKTAWVFGEYRATQFAVDLLGAFDWQHRVRIFNDDIDAARAWLNSTIR